jgi:predicted AAA+ superfamily ATPase
VGSVAPGAGLQQFRNILKKAIAADVPASQPQITLEELSRLEKLVEFVGRSPIDGINYSSLSANLGITKYRAERYVDLLERSFILRRALPAGTNLLREPKIFLELPYRLLYRRFEDCVGELREDFFAAAMAQHGATFAHAKSTRGAKTPDFVVTLNDRPVVIEVGGRGKGRSQFKGLDYDRKVVLYHGEGRPVSAAGGSPRPGLRKIGVQKTRRGGHHPLFGCRTDSVVALAR